MSLSPLRVMLVDDDPERRALVAGALAGAGLAVVAELATADGLIRAVASCAPDVVIIDLESPDRDILDSLAVLNRHQPTPVVMFAREQDPAFIREAIAAGVSAYLAEGVDPDKVRTVIEVAIAQFGRYQALRQDFEEACQQLEERRLVDHAKRLLMAHQRIDEAQAYANDMRRVVHGEHDAGDVDGRAEAGMCVSYMRKLAMNTNQTLAAVATGVLAILDKNSKESSR